VSWSRAAFPEAAVQQKGTPSSPRKRGGGVCGSQPERLCRARAVAPASAGRFLAEAGGRAGQQRWKRAGCSREMSPSNPSGRCLHASPGMLLGQRALRMPVAQDPVLTRKIIQVWPLLACRGYLLPAHKPLGKTDI